MRKASAGLKDEAYQLCKLDASNAAPAGPSELNAALKDQWLPVGRAEELPEIGSYFTWERTGVPTLLVRSVDGKIRGFYNSCRHRGAPVVRTATGRSRAFRCQYHSWTYDSYGSLLSIPDERDFGDIDRCDHGLVPLSMAESGGWLWINPEGNPAGSETALAAYEPMAVYHQSLIYQGRATQILNADWASVQPVVGAISLGQNMAPNFAFHHEKDGAYLLGIWPRDDLRLDVEVVACVAPNAAEGRVDAQQYLDRFVADIGG